MKMLVTVLAASAAVGAIAVDERIDVLNDWAAVSSERYRDGTVDLTSANGWQMPQGVASVSNHVINVNDEVTAGNLAYVPQASQALNRQSVDMSFPSVEIGGIPDGIPGAMGAITAANDGDGNAWYGWCADGWMKLTGATPPTTGGCDVRMEFNHKENKVRYFVKTGDSSWVELKLKDTDETGWLEKETTGSTLQNVAFTGKTSLTNVTLTQVGTVTNTPTMESRMTAQGVKTEDMNDVAKNGNRNWENLVLGLTGSDTASKPVVMPVQTSNASKLTLKLGGVDVDTGAGATVKYTVTASDQIGGAGTTTGPIAYNDNASVDLPSGTKYYRMTVTTTPGN